MNIKLLRGAESNNLEIAIYAARNCHQSFDRSDNGGEKDKQFLNNICNNLNHGSIIEHLVYTFDIDGVSRALLQEFARHRMASLSVKSTRYTLKELKDEDPFIFPQNLYTDELFLQRITKYVVLLPLKMDYIFINSTIIDSLENLRSLVSKGYPSDLVKYSLPDAYKTQIVWTINGRSLQNFLKLRSSKSALWEMRVLARNIFNILPNDHKYLYEHCMDNSKIKYVDE